MQTTITLNEHLINEAYQYLPESEKAFADPTKIAEFALQEFVERHKKQKDKKLSDLKGKITFADDYDYKQMRQ